MTHGGDKHGTKLICHLEEDLSKFFEERGLNEEEQYIGESAADGPFTVKKDTEIVHGEVKHGTKVIGHPMEHYSDFSWEPRLNEVGHYICESVAGGSLTVQKDTEMVHGGVKHGTQVFCHLQEDHSKFFEERGLKDLVQHHSEVVGFSMQFYVDESKDIC